MIKYVTLAERYEEKIKSKKMKIQVKKKKMLNIKDIMPILRGNLDNYFLKKSIMSFRTNKAIRESLQNINIIKSLQLGTITPDHVIRIKPFPLFIPENYLINIKFFKDYLKKEIIKYHSKYLSYFEKNSRHANSKKIMLNPCPSIIYLQGLGLVSLGNNSSLSEINADIAEQNINVISKIERTQKFKTISQKDLFEVEYWSLEQAKIKKNDKELLGNIVVITGGTGVIGEATLKLFKSKGAEVVVLDINEKKLKSINDKYNILTIFCDVTDKKSVVSAFNQVVKKFGGIDILISNAGNAPQGPIASISEDLLRSSFEVNFFSHQNCASVATNIMISQNTKGCLIFNISKQSVNPGKYFGPYGLPKAALLNLCKQYALDYGEYGIRSNGVNADRIMSGMLNKKMIKKRSKARKLNVNQYMRGNLLLEEVYAEDVAKGFLHLVLSKKSTGAVLTIDGENIAASMR
jgi:NAD(P)-dependent dehydrogenase (short-subunit alcohol dehydrogenase family)